MAVIDADAHVVESEHTWDFIPESMQSMRPIVLYPKEGYISPSPEFWYIDGRASTKGLNLGPDTDAATREASDIAKRLAHMDELEVSMHVLYPTMFLNPLATHPEVELALVMGYNRWLADIYRQGGGRLRWAVVLPLMSIDKSLEEMQFGKENGACAVFVRGIEGHASTERPLHAPALGGGATARYAGLHPRRDGQPSPSSTTSGAITVSRCSSSRALARSMTS